MQYRSLHGFDLGTAKENREEFHRGEHGGPQRNDSGCRFERLPLCGPLR